MKKFLVLAAAASLSASSALAGAGDFYAKGTVGYAKFNNEKLKIEGAPTDLEKMKSKSGGAAFGIGAGYYITDIVRADLMLEHFSNMQHKSLATVALPANGSRPAGSYNAAVKLKSRATTAMVNGYVDFADVSDVKFFAGVGLGVVKFDTKVNFSLKHSTTGAVISDETTKLKTKKVMTYALHLGASTQVVDNVNVDLTYSWRDLGSLKHKDSGITDSGNFPYRGHHVALGIRYDI